MSKARSKVVICLFLDCEFRFQHFWATEIAQNLNTSTLQLRHSISLLPSASWPLVVILSQVILIIWFMIQFSSGFLCFVFLFYPHIDVKILQFSRCPTHRFHLVNLWIFIQFAIFLVCAGFLCQLLWFCAQFLELWGIHLFHALLRSSRDLSGSRLLFASLVFGKDFRKLLIGWRLFQILLLLKVNWIQELYGLIV